MKNKQLIISIATLFTLSSSLIADESSQFQVGGIVISGESLYVDGDTKTRPLPTINYQKGLFFIEGMEVGGILLNNEALKVTGSIAMDTHDIDRGDSSTLSDMESLDRAVDAKLGAVWRTPLAKIKANVRRDIAGAHEGIQAGLELSKPMILGETKVAPFVGADWMSADTANYYYGVSATDAKAGRAAYDADNSVILSAGIKAMYPITKNLSVLGLAKIQHFDSEITDSPIVDKDQAINIGLGLIYNF